jgi:hypothetical protein
MLRTTPNPGISFWIGFASLGADFSHRKNQIPELMSSGLTWLAARNLETSLQMMPSGAAIS